MIIHRLKIQHFKKFQDYEIRLQPGLNVIKGPNEAGKSTLLEVLISTFFYDSHARVDGYKTWNSPERPKLELEFSVDEQRLMLKKDFEEPSFSLGYTDGSREETFLKKIKKLLTGFLGFDSDKAFLATSCIRQHELDMVTAEKTPFKLENILLGGSDSVDVSGVIKQLGKSIDELKRKGTKNPGPLATLPTMIQELDGPLKRMNILENERAKLNKELNQLKERYKPKSILMDRAQGYRKWKKENERLSQEFNDIHRKITEIKSLHEKLTQCENKITQNRHFETLDKAEELRWKITRFSNKLRWYWWLVFILTVGIAFFIYKIRIKRVLNQAKCGSIDEFNRIYSEYKALHQAKERLQVKLEDCSLDKLEQEKTDISRRLAVNEAQLTTDIEMASLSPEELITLEEEVKKVSDEVQRLTDQYAECGARISEITRGKGDRIEIEERLNSLSEELNRVKMRFEVLSLARDIMERARKDVLYSSIEDFNKEIASYLALFTQQRYIEIKTNISEDGMQFLIYSPEKGEWVKPEELSSGTQDQLYLAARVTLLKLVARERRPPLIMDDPFTSFDYGRLNSAMQVCKEIAKEYQVILFTCTDHYDRFADNIIQLEYEPQKITTL